MIKGGKRAVVFFRLMKMCRLNGVNPYAYLNAIVVSGLAIHLDNRVEALLPYNTIPTQ